MNVCKQEDGRSTTVRIHTSYISFLINQHIRECNSGRYASLEAGIKQKQCRTDVILLSSKMYFLVLFLVDKLIQICYQAFRTHQVHVVHADKHAINIFLSIKIHACMRNLINDRNRTDFKIFEKETATNYFS